MHRALDNSIVRLTAFIALLVSLAVAPQSSAQTLTWDDINGITEVSQLNCGSGGKIFAVNSYGFSDSKFFFSTDDGMSWLRSPTAVGTIVSMSTNGSNILVERYIYGVQLYHQVFLSKDNGTTFTRILADHWDTGPFLLSDSGIIFGNISEFNLPSPVIRYGGSRWDTLGKGIVGSLIAVDHDNNLYAGSLWVSRDYGRSWSQCFSRDVDVLAVDAGNRAIAGVSATIDAKGVMTRTGGVLVSTDLGQTWGNIGLVEQEFHSLAMDSASNIYAATSQGIYRYTSSAGKWSDISPVHDVFSAVQVTPAGTVLASSSTVYPTVTAHPGVYRSTDGGATWSVSGLRKRAVFCVAIARNGELAVGMLGERVLTSTDAGASWQQAPTGSVADDVFSLTSDSTGLYAATAEGLYASAYGSQDWRNVSAASVSGAVYSAVISSTGTMFIGTNFGVYVSSDHAATWSVSGLGTSKVLFLASSPSDVLYAATERDGVYSSTDGGGTWESRGLVRSDLQCVATDESGNVLVGVYGGIMRSSDGGSTWAQSTFAQSYVYGIATQGAQTIFAGTYAGVMVSYDAGAAWKSGGLAGQTVMSFAFTPAGNLVAGAYHGGVFETAQVITSVGSGGGLPLSDELLPNYPNPFNPSTSVSFVIGPAGGGSVARLSVYDLLGREVAVLVNGRLRPGRHTVVWNASGLPSGIYFCRLQTGKFVGVRKLVLAK